MPYNLGQIQQQLDNIQRQYNQLVNQQLPGQNNTNFSITPPTTPRQVQYVDGMNGAILYQQNMPSNSSEIVLDRNEDIFYFVSKDANGTPSKTIQSAHFQLDEPQIEEEPVFLTRKDLDNFKEELKQIFQSQKEVAAPATAQTPTKGGNNK